MSHPDDEILSQHIDGELPEHESAALLRRLEQEPELAGRLESLRRVDAVLQATLSRAAIEPPEHVVGMLQPESGNVVPLRPANRPFWQAAIAASLLAGMGFLAGQQWPGDSSLGGALPGASAVHAALESQRSAAEWQNLDSGYQLRPVLSFADKAGTYCREYELSGQGQGWRGVACRVQGQWQTQVLVSLGNTTTGSDNYRVASAESNALVALFIDQRMDGVPLGAEEENARIDSDWR